MRAMLLAALGVVSTGMNSAMALTSTKTAIASSVNPSYVSQNITLTATVTPSAATGTVTFKDGTTTLGTGTLSSGVASLPKNFTTTGSHSLTAVYGGNSTYATSTSAAATQTVNAKLTTTTALASSVNPTYVSQNTVLTASVTPSTATGTVNFKDGTTTLGTGTLSSGVATLTKSLSTAGTHSLTAVYAGDAADATSTSAAVTQTVKAKLTTTTALASSVNPTYVSQNTLLTATVTPSTATGTVTFKDGTTSLGSATLSGGVATVTASMSTAGAHSLTAVYAGDTANATSTSAAVAQTVNSKIVTSTALTSGFNPTYVGQTTTLTATVTPSTATGKITFMDGTTSLGTANLSGGVATANKSLSTAGAHSLTAVYAGDTSNATSTSAAVAQTVNAKPATATTLASSVNPAYLNQYTTLTATVTPSTATGTVTFMDGSTTLGTGYNYGGVAQLGVSFSVAGSHSLTAVYPGDATNATSTSAAVTQAVNAPATTSTALSVAPSSVYLGRSATFKAVLTPATATGTVTFTDASGNLSLGTTTVSNGVVTLTTAPGSLGFYNVTATYSGDVADIGSTSGTVTLNVIPLPATTTVLTSSINPASVGQNTLLTANVSPSTATGSVAFYDGSTFLGQVNSIGGVAKLNVSFSTAGAHSLKAVYQGDANDDYSTSAATSQTVNAAATAATMTMLTAASGTSNFLPAIVLSAYVNASNATGTLTFLDGSAVVGTAPVISGLAKLTTNLVPGTSPHSFYALYSGDASYSPSTSALSYMYASSTVALTSSANPISLGQGVTITATVSPPTVTGQVVFTDGGAALGFGNVNSGLVTIPATFTTSGAHNLVANYQGDSTFGSASSPTLNEVVNPNSSAVSATTLVLSAASDSVVSGIAVPLSADIAGSTPSGNIVFKDGSTVIATVAVGSGHVTAAPTLSGAGLHVITASYAGDANNQASDSNAIGIQVSAGTASNPGPMTWLYGYDPQGNPWVEIDPLGQQTSRNFDNLNRQTQLVRPAPAGATTPTTVSMAYDGQDNLTAVVDPRNLSTAYSVDGLKNVKVQTSPDTGASTSTFDAAGNMLTRTDSRGKVTTYTYDTLNRMTSASYASGTPTVFQYDGGVNPAPFSAGRLTLITDESGSTAYTYDFQGRVLTKTQTVGNSSLVMSYTWGNTGSATGQLSTMTYPSGARANYAYDSAGRVSAITVNPTNANGIGTNTGSTINVLSAITYNGANAVTGWTWSNATVYQRTYDSFGRLATYPLGNPAGTGAAAGLTRTLTYDNAGQILGYTHTSATGPQAQFDQAFAYDNLGRLNSNTQSTTSYSYTYDASGNRTLRVVGGSSYANTISGTSNRLNQSQSPAGVVTFGYDNAGNMLSDATASYVYSDRGRMGSATIGSNTVNYRYNGLGQRVSKLGPAAVVPSGAAYYAYDEAGQLTGEFEANLSPIYETVYFGSTPVAVLKQAGSAPGSTLQTAVFNVYADHIDTPRVITRSSDQAIVWRWDTAEAFGATSPDQNPNALGTFAFNQRFTGQILDLETGNFYNRNRDYRPTGGGYAQSDPIGLAGGINTYQYAGGNPISFTDPRGLVKWSGSVTSVAGVSGVGAGGFMFDLTSECKCGVRMNIKGFASTLAAGVGLTYTGSTGSSDFSDIFPCPLANTANGPAGVIAASSIGGVHGASYGAMKLGSLSSGYPSLSKGLTGLDLSAGVYVGWSVVTSSSVTKCDDCEAGK